MQILASSFDFFGFLNRVQHAAACLLMLDYDGTLAPFHVRPERAQPYPRVVSALDEIARDGRTRIVIVSGRRIAEIEPLLKLRSMPEIWGAHGWERRLADGTIVAQAPEDAQRTALDAALNGIMSVVPLGTRVECKPASVAVHWRGMPVISAAAIRAQVSAVWGPLVREAGLELLAFDGGLELRARGCNKQSAVKTVLAETAADVPAAYFGDDITDEDAFAAMKSRGVSVLVRRHFRTTRADVWIRPPGELLSVLKFWSGSGFAS